MAHGEEASCMTARDAVRPRVFAPAAVAIPHEVSSEERVVCRTPGIGPRFPHGSSPWAEGLGVLTASKARRLPCLTLVALAVGCGEERKRRASGGCLGTERR
jgi:hypothetical protein